MRMRTVTAGDGGGSCNVCPPCFSHLLATLRLAAKPLCYRVCCVMSVNETSTRLELFSEHLSGGCFVDATIIDSEKILPFCVGIIRSCVSWSF